MSRASSQNRFGANHGSGEKGATMLETAVVIIAFMTLLGAIFDLGVALYQFSMLRHTTNLAARDITVELATANFASGGGCTVFDGVVNGYLTGKATPLMSRGGTNTMNPTWYTCMRDNGAALRSFRVRGIIPVNCYFLCRFFGANWRLRADSVVTVDTSNIPSCHVEPDC